MNHTKTSKAVQQTEPLPSYAWAVEEMMRRARETTCAVEVTDAERLELVEYCLKYYGPNGTFASPLDAPFTRDEIERLLPLVIRGYDLIDWMHPLGSQKDLAWSMGSHERDVLAALVFAARGEPPIGDYADIVRAILAREESSR